MDAEACAAYGMLDNRSRRLPGCFKDTRPIQAFDWCGAYSRREH